MSFHLLYSTSKNVQEKQTIQTSFPQGSSQTYGLCRNWVSLIWNGAIVTETHKSIPPHSCLCMSNAHLKFTLPCSHTAHVHTQTHFSLITATYHLPWASCPFLFSLPPSSSHLLLMWGSIVSKSNSACLHFRLEGNGEAGQRLEAPTRFRLDRWLS